jgi:hypothetical protein
MSPLLTGSTVLAIAMACLSVGQDAGQSRERLIGSWEATCGPTTVARLRLELRSDGLVLFGVPRADRDGFERIPRRIQGRFEVDASVRPARMNWTNIQFVESWSSSGLGTQRSLPDHRAIYELSPDEQVLRIASGSLDGERRPTEFPTKASETTVQVLEFRRVNP